jgi:Flp pilus assembly protein TadD
MNGKVRRAHRQPIGTAGTNCAPATRPARNTTAAAPIFNAVPSLFAQAVGAHQRGQLAVALALYDRILSLKSDLPEVHCNRGIALFGLGRAVDAEAAHRRALALNPNYAEAHNNLGIALCELGRFDDAETALRHAVKLRPGCAQCHTNLGIALKAQGRYREAEAAHCQAIALDPRYPDAYSNMGEVLRCVGRLEEAEAALRRAVALRPHFADAFAKLGNVLRDRGRLEEAEAACRQAIALDPAHAGAYSSLGNVLDDQDRPIDAEAAYRRAIALKPTFAEAYNNLAALLKHRGRLAEARRVVEHTLQFLPRNALHFLNLSDVNHFSVGDPHLTAMEELARDISSLPVKQQIELHFALAKAYDDFGRREDCFRQLSAGNALKRRQVPYDEAAMLAALERTRALFTPELMRAMHNVGEPTSLPVFVVGMPRSGTTLIEQIMASHPQMFGAGELSNLHDAVAWICSAGNASFPAGMVKISGERLRALGARYVADLPRRAPKATLVIDKMPSNFLFAGLIHLALPNARIIHAVRDPVDTCMSCFAKLFAAGQYHTYDLAELGRYYRGYQALMQHWHAILPPGRILDVCYEDVVADLEGQARRIIAHCALSWDDSCLSFHKTDRPVRTASATQVRQPIYRNAIGRWRAHEQLLAPLLAALYPANVERAKTGSVLDVQRSAEDMHA